MQNYITLFNQLNAKGENIEWNLAENRPYLLMVYPGSQAMFELLPQSYPLFDADQYELMDDPKYDVWTNKAVCLIIDLKRQPNLDTDLHTIIRLKRERFN